MNRLPMICCALLVACAAPAEQRDSIGTPAAQAEAPVRGTVRIVGSAPINVQVVLQPPSGTGIRLTGPLAGELARLAGLEVAVWGPVTSSPDPIVNRQMEAVRYEIEAANGRPVVTGEVVGIDRGVARLRLAGGEEVLISGAPAEFRVGQKVWVQGPRSITVQSYGVVRP